jgi:2-keto-3-deoxy-L-rhamnonate aldolase RhmA
MTGRQLKDTLKKGKRIYGTAILSDSSLWPMAVKQSGLDFVFIDTEHIPIGREKLSNMCQIYKAIGLPPVVRIPSPDPFEACKVLDGGAVGIMAPYIESVDQVKALVGATKFRPLKGEKLEKILNNFLKMEDNLEKYVRERCINNVLWINVESVKAVENLDEIISVPGLDGVIIGPHDLSCSLNVPEDYTNPLFEKTVDKIIRQTRDKNLPIGIHFSEDADTQIKWANVGTNIILQSSDISLFGKALKSDIDTIRRELNETRSESDSDKIII